MNVFVDGNLFQLETEPADAFAALVTVIEHLKEEARGIVSVRVNNEDISPQDLLDRLRNKSIEEVATLEVRSERITKLVHDSLAELREAVGELPRLCRSLAAIFHSDNPEEGYDPFHRLAELWSHVKSRELQVAEALSLDLASAEFDGVTTEELHEELNQYLEQAAEALAGRDCVVLGDLLQYELAPRAEVETKIVYLLEAEAGALESSE